MSLGSHGFALVKAGSFAKIKTVHDTSACEVFLATRNPEEATAAAGAGDAVPNSSDGSVIVVRRTKIVGPNSLDSFDLQSELYALCDHPNIVRPMALCMDPPTYAQVLPLAKYGSLYELLHDPARETQRQVLSWPLSFAIAHDIAAAINYLHNDLGLLFRDLKPANVLVFDDFSAKLTDFDTVKFVDESRNRTKTVYHHGPSGGFHKAFIAGTLVYMAPELMMNRPYTPPADVYSLGVTMNELATGCIPYSDVETTTLQFHTVIEANYSQQALMQDITTKHLRPNPATRAPSYAGASPIPAEYTNLAKQCWAGNADSRPSAAKVLASLNKLATENGFGDIVADLKIRQQHAEKSAKAAASLKPATSEIEDTGNVAQLPAAAGDAASAGATRLTRAEATAKKSKAKVKAWNQFFSQRNDEDLRRRSSKIDWKTFVNTAGGDESTYVPVVRGGGLASFGLRGEDNMEDTFFVFESLDTATSSTGYGSAHIYGVADGHAGPGAAVFVQANFVDTLLSVLEEAQAKGEETTMPAALTEAFLRVDAAFVKWAKENDDSSGCALVVCVVIGGTVYVANAGDCRAVVSRKTYDDVQDLSLDHNTSNPAERRRITEDFGTKIITTADGKRRVAGRIEATRSIGDPELKKFGLTSEPEVQVYQVGKTDQVIVLATDGVWDVMSSALAGRYLINTICHEDYGAKRIVSEALSLGSTDNVTAVALYLYDPASKDHERDSKF